MSAQPSVRHIASEKRLETGVDGHTSVLDYELDGKVMTITHTGVPAALRGRGIASELVRAAFALAGEQHWKVVPACSYARTWAERHPESRSLLA